MELHYRYPHMIKPITIVTLIVLSVGLLQGQNRFKVAALGGINVSQIDGDNYQGYDKVGINIGLQAGVVFSKRFQVNMGLLFTQKGSLATAEQFQKNFTFRS
ncbi:MAG: outer membrane beta-barrel protein, partial [Saprospiraceae bacterium]|nr:outer membrane beta-barrel protein [Saprospiraceae bacterium]